MLRQVLRLSNLVALSSRTRYGERVGVPRLQMTPLAGGIWHRHDHARAVDATICGHKPGDNCVNEREDKSGELLWSLSFCDFVPPPRGCLHAAGYARCCGTSM